MAPAGMTISTRLNTGGDVMTVHLTDKREFGALGTTQRLMLRGLLFLLALIGLSAAVGGMSRASAGRAESLYTGTAILTELRELRQRLDVARGELELVSIERDRVNGILDLAARFKVPADLATLIYDVAQREGLDPELAFRLVRVESNFNPRARSHAAAFGLAQVQLATARHYEPNITEEQLLEPERNLRIGFKYLRHLTLRYQNDLRLALLAYNVGPSRLNEILEGGKTPTGKYAAQVLDGYTFRATGD
jgi:soluble lytic murein transglycosylase-like protein